LIDTPGLGDTDNRDSEHISEMVKILKEQKKINAFILCFNIQEPRFD
jgi:hypothetical protein